MDAINLATHYLQRLFDIMCKYIIHKDHIFYLTHYI